MAELDYCPECFTTNVYLEDEPNGSNECCIYLKSTFHWLFGSLCLSPEEFNKLYSRVYSRYETRFQIQQQDYNSVKQRLNIPDDSLNPSAWTIESKEQYFIRGKMQCSKRNVIYQSIIRPTVNDNGEIVKWNKIVHQTLYPFERVTYI